MFMRVAVAFAALAGIAFNVLHVVKLGALARFETTAAVLLISYGWIVVLCLLKDTAFAKPEELGKLGYARVSLGAALLGASFLGVNMIYTLVERVYDQARAEARVSQLPASNNLLREQKER